MSFRSTVGALLGIALISAVASGQQGGTILGRVLDRANGHALAEAQVVLNGPDTVTVRSDTRGEWRARDLHAGRYRVKVRLLGYAVRESVAEIAAGQTTESVVRLDAVALSLDQIGVTAARREQKLKDAVTTTEVVTRADIERTGATDIGSVLISRTGIELQGGHPAGTGVMLQGLGSERVLILLDGQPIAGRISGVFDVSRIPTSVVERIEVVKGPQSTLYGTEAMGGVINIITRRPVSDALGASLIATAGTQAQRDGSARLTFGRGAFASSVDVGRRNTEITPGISSAQGALASRTDGAAKAIWTPDSTVAVEASALLLDERQRYLTGSLYNFGDNVQWTGKLTGTFRRGAHQLVPTFSTSRYDHLNRASEQTKPIVGDTGSRQLQNVTQGELLYNGRYGPSGAHALDIGALWRRDETETDRVPGGLRALNTLEPFEQFELAVTPALSFVEGVRVSSSEQWGTHVSPRLAMRWRPTGSLTLRASAGEGFRAPDFKELYFVFRNASAGYSVFGNPNLRPESSRNVMGGVEWAVDKGYVRAQLFQNTFRDFIETRLISKPDEAPVYDYGNVDNGFTRGVELEGGRRFASLNGLRLEASYSGLSTRDNATGFELLGRPTNAGRVGLIGELPFALRTSVTGVYTGRTPMERDATSGAISSWRDSFLRVDLRVARALTGRASGFELVAGADNLFGRQPAQWAGFTGRHVYTALSWTMSKTSDDTNTQ